MISLGDAAVFSTLDANSAYWQVGIKETDQNKSCHGLYRFEQRPFRLNNAPETFQRVIDVILLPIKWQFALAYCDDIIDFLRSSCEHIENVKRVL